MSRWTHTDAVSLTDFIDASLARARGDAPWRPTPGDVAALRGVQLARCLVVAALVGTVSVTEGNELAPLARVDINPAPVGGGAAFVERRDAAAVLMRTASLLSDGQSDTRDIDTTSRGPSEVAAWPIALGAAVAVVGLAQAGAVGYIVHRTTELIDRRHSREAEIRKLQQKDAAALEVLKRHTEREANAGKALPLDEASKAVLGMLEKVQQTLAAKKEDPMSSPSTGGLLGLGMPPVVEMVAAGLVGYGIAKILD